MRLDETGGPKPKFWLWTSRRSGPPGMKKYMPAIGANRLLAASSQSSLRQSTMRRMAAALSIITMVTTREGRH